MAPLAQKAFAPAGSGIRGILQIRTVMAVRLLLLPLDRECLRIETAGEAHKLPLPWFSFHTSNVVVGCSCANGSFRMFNHVIAPFLAVCFMSPPVSPMVTSMVHGSNPSITHPALPERGRLARHPSHSNTAGPGSSHGDCTSLSAP